LLPRSEGEIGFVTEPVVMDRLIFAGLALLTLVFSMVNNILAYFWVYLLVEFAVFVMRRTRLVLQRQKLAIAAKSNVASLKK
jgi:hypothetical protein